MALQKLRRHYDERRTNLIQTLQKGNKTLDLSKQHQLYGAIKEIENFMKSIDNALEESLSSADFELRREGPLPLRDRTAGALQEAGTKTRKAVGGFFVTMGDAIVGVVRGTKNRILFIGEVIHEVKKRKK